MEEVAGQPSGLAARASESRDPGLQGHQHEDKVLLVLTLIIGAIVGLVVVAFIVLTENVGARLYPAGGAAWRRVFIPIFGALSTGFLLFRYFPNARGSGIPQTKAALFLRDGYISFKTVLGKFGLCSLSLGDAQFALANYRRADDAFRNALKIDASDQLAARRAETCEKVLALDPGMPGIDVRERYKRARNILSNIADELTACSASEPSEHSESVAKLVEARSLLSEKKRSASFSDAADTTITLAIELWKTRLAGCAAPGGDSPLQRIMAKLTAR